jgi:L-asparaginase II
MLAVCRASGWPAAGYRLAEHPVQRQNLRDVAAAAQVDPEAIATAVDGCGVVTYALELRQMAGMFSRLETTDEGKAVAAAMRAWPELVRGPGGTDTLLMRTIPGSIAKGGAEGLACGTLPDGTGFAFKSEDGEARALRPAVATVLATLGYTLPEFAEVPVENSRGERVGTISIG